jgi:hypothetical protein
LKNSFANSFLELCNFAVSKNKIAVLKNQFKTPHFLFKTPHFLLNNSSPKLACFGEFRSWETLCDYIYFLSNNICPHIFI